MPVVRTGNARAVRIRALMTRSTVQARHTFVSRAADNVKQMAVPVIALLRIVRGGMAINATRMRQYRIDLLPRDKAGLACCRGSCLFPRHALPLSARRRRRTPGTGHPNDTH